MDPVSAARKKIVDAESAEDKVRDAKESEYARAINARRKEAASETPADADKLAEARGMPEYQSAHAEMLKRLRAGGQVPHDLNTEGGDGAETGRVWMGSTQLGVPFTPERAAMLAKREAREAFDMEQARAAHKANK
jgi:hypothetical protein